MFENFSWRNVWESARKFTHTALHKYAMFVLRLSPSQNILQGMILYTLLGWLALSLPFMDNGQVGLLDNLFTAASAMSTAGLNSVNFAESYTFLGKLVILLLIQAGGIGYMTMSSFLYLSFSRRLRPRHKEVLNTEFALPRTVRLQDFLRTAIIFTFIAELIGAAFLYNYFHRHGYSAAEAVWYGIFHSVSAFCTAGITLFPDNLVSFADSKTINIVISVLSLAGAMGFIVVTDMFNWLVRRTKEISYTSKIIVVFTLGALLMATFFILITNPHLTAAQAAFQATSAMTTAGFNTVPLSALSAGALMVLMALMSVGGSPSGTGGGIKTTAATCLLAIVSSHLQGRKQITFLGKEIPTYRLYIATSSFIFYIFLLFVTLFLLVWTESLPFLDLLFEATAALATAGISSGVSGQLSPLGKLIIIAAMLIGRVGVITFGMALLNQTDEDEEPEPPAKHEDLAV